MRARKITVLGAGVAGLSTALVLARDGHQVTLVEGDDLEAGTVEAAPTWRRTGIPHFLQPHAFIPRGRTELLRLLPDVHAAMLAAGARDVDVRNKIPGHPGGDDDLQYIAVRRPVIEWALRRAVRADPSITVATGAWATGLVADRGRVTGLQVDGQRLDAEVLIDAGGRRSPVPAWLQAEGLPAGSVDQSDCGVVYYSRYYRLRPGHELPDGPWFLSPRGDLGFAGYATFPGDNGTFSVLLSVPPRTPEWRALNDSKAFEAAVALIPAMAAWADPAAADPITDILPMAGLRNSLRSYSDGAPAGVIPVGDALGHTDPVLAHGLSFALIHAGAVACALREHADAGDATDAFLAATARELRERFDLASALDAQRLRMWTGDTVDFLHREGDYALFALVAGGAAALRDGEVARVFLRRIGLLDSTQVLDDDVAMQQRIEDLFAELRAQPRPPAGPSREEMLAALQP